MQTSPPMRARLYCGRNVIGRDLPTIAGGDLPLYDWNLIRGDRQDQRTVFLRRGGYDPIDYGKASPTVAIGKSFDPFRNGERALLALQLDQWSFTR